MYDTLLPISTNEIDIQGEYALYLRFKIPRFVTASKYNGILVLEGNQDKLEVPFSIKFFNVCLPENIDFHLVNWWDFQLETYGCELFDDHYWDTVVKIATLARYAHPQEVWTLIYATNTIEGFNRQPRKVTKSK